MEIRDPNQISVFLANQEEYRFDNHGDFHADGNIIAFSSTVPSDINLKMNVATINDALYKTLSLRGVTYEWKPEMHREGTEIGLIAQEVEAVVPEIVKQVGFFDRQIKTVEYEKITAILIEAIKEQQQQIVKLQEQVKQLVDGTTGNA